MDLFYLIILFFVYLILLLCLSCSCWGIFVDPILLLVFWMTLFVTILNAAIINIILF